MFEIPRRTDGLEESSGEMLSVIRYQRLRWTVFKDPRFDERNGNRMYKRQSFVRARLVSTSRSGPTSRGEIDDLSWSSSIVREYRLPGIQGVYLQGIFEGGASVFGASRGSSHSSYSCGSFYIYGRPSAARNMFLGYVGACGSVRGGASIA